MWLPVLFLLLFQKYLFQKFGAQNPENHKYKTIKISMMAMKLKSLPDFLVLFCFMITVNLGKFTLTTSVTNLSCKHSLSLNFVLQKEILFHVCLKRFKEAVAKTCSVKRCSYKSRKIHRKTPVPESLF